MFNSILPVSKIGLIAFITGIILVAAGMYGRLYLPTDVADVSHTYSMSDWSKTSGSVVYYENSLQAYGTNISMLVGFFMLMIGGGLLENRRKSGGTISNIMDSTFSKK